MTTPEHRPPLVGIFVIVGCFAAFTALVRVPLLDAFDAMFPTRDRVAAKAGGGARWKVEVLEGATDSAEVHEALAVLSPAYRQLVERFDGKLVITTEAMLSQVPTAYPQITHTAGVYVPDGRVAYVAHDSGEPGWTALHELGHLIDHALGGLSDQPAFDDVYARLRTDERMTGYARTHPRECFAELFARYYFSDRRRRHLEERFPTAADYVADLEARIVELAESE